MNGPARRDVLAGALAAGVAGPAVARARRIRLRPQGPERPLPDALFALAAPAPELEDPVFSAAAAQAAADAVTLRPVLSEQAYAAMLAQADEGLDRAVSEAAAGAPARPIWISGWGGGLSAFTGASLHQVARALLVQLRRREVSLSTYAGVVSRRDAAGRAAPVNAADVLSWVFRAARGPGAYHRRLVAEGAQRIAEGELGYRDVEAGLLRQGRRRTAFVHNAAPDPREIDLSRLMPERTRILAECVETPDLAASLQQSGPPHGRLVLGDRRVTVPPYSLTRIVWTEEA